MKNLSALLAIFALGLFIAAAGEASPTVDPMSSEDMQGTASIHWLQMHQRIIWRKQSRSVPGLKFAASSCRGQVCKTNADCCPGTTCQLVYTDEDGKKFTECMFSD